MKSIKKTNPISKFILLISILTLNFLIAGLSQLDNLYEKDDQNFNIKSLKSQGTYEEEFTEEWINNPGFNGPISPWFNISSDSEDLNATNNSNQGNFQLLGDKGTFSLVSSPPTSSNWIQKTNPNFPFLPDIYTINQSGFYVSHDWREGADQSPSVHWDQNVTLPVNMSDYSITSASIRAICNATVTTPSTQPYSDGVDTPDDTADPFFQVATGDYIRFYILISDLNKENVFEIAYNQTYNLGQDLPAISTMANTFMDSIPEDTLIYYLTSVLSSDYQNFTITAGIRIWCEDNFPQDSDVFNDIIINHLNLTFSYVKKIDQLSTLSWNQIGNTLSGSNLDITSAKLNFLYKLDDIWPDASPNSEIQILINGSLHSEAIKLTSATLTFQEAKLGGLDITNLIQKDVNISVSIQLYVADSFGLDRLLTLSIDNVSLIISYRIVNNEDETHLSLFLNGQNKTLSGYMKLALNEFLNISVTYLDSNFDFVPNASVLLYGIGNPKNLTENSIDGVYYFIINTTDLSLGQNYLTVKASKYKYELRENLFIIDVIKRNCYIDEIFLNNVQTNSIDTSWNSTIEISLSFKDTISNAFIHDAEIDLLGTGISKSFLEISSSYNLSIDTSELEFGPNYLTISAVEENHLPNSTYIIVNVAIREASLEIFVNGLSEESFEFFNVSIGQNLNLTIFYKDLLTDMSIGDSNIELFQGTNFIGQFSEQSQYSQYNFSILSDNIGSGIKVLTISAQKENFTSFFKEIQIIVGERATDLFLFLNGTQTLQNDNYSLEIGESLNVTANFKDNLTSSHLSGAELDIIGYGTFNEDLVNENYIFVINSEDLSQGFTYLTIIAQLDNYESQTIDIILEVKERGTSYQIFLNEIDRTSDRYAELPIGSILNVTIKYIDTKTSSWVTGASVKFQGDLSYDFEESILLQQYSYLVNTTELDIGVSILSLLLLKDNYQPQSPDLTVVVRRINSTITTDSGENLLNAVPGQNYMLMIKLLNEDFGGLIYNATVMYSWVFGQGQLSDEDHDGIFTKQLNNLIEGTYDIVITVYAGDDYSFDRYELTLSIVREGEAFDIFTSLLIFLPLLLLVIASFILYEKKYKVPLPIRKLRKYRKTLNKESGVENINIIQRETAIKAQIKNKIDKINKVSKTKKKSHQESSLMHEDANILAK